MPYTNARQVNWTLLELEYMGYCMSVMDGNKLTSQQLARFHFLRKFLIDNGRLAK